MDARAAHCDWFVAWLEAVPIDERMWSVTFWGDFIAEFDNISTAIEWAIDRRDFIAAAEFLLSGAGVFLVGIGSGQAMRWVSVLLLEDLDGRTRARALTTGALAAVSAGVHDKIIPWSEEAAALSFDEEAIVYAVASTFHATPKMVRQPLRAAELLAVAAQVATAPGLALTRALINSYTLMAEFCAEQPTQPVVALVDAPRFGGQGSASWSTAASVGMIVEAQLGRLDPALALLQELDPSAVGLAQRPKGYEAFVVAMAGDPTGI